MVTDSNGVYSNEDAARYRYRAIMYKTPPIPLIPFATEKFYATNVSPLLSVG
jgi:hypothetical protein